MINKEYSFKDFTHQVLGDVILTGTIKGSCFHSEDIDTPLGHADSDAHFVRCNLDNRLLPANCTQEDCTNKSIKMQNDLEPWVMKDGLPFEPLSKTEYIRFGLSIDPLDVPAVEMEDSILSIAKEAS